MNFIKEVLKKLLIAAITGALILAFVYYKDNYLEEGRSDMEMLNSVTLEKDQSLKSEPQKIVTNKEEEPLKIEVQTPHQEEPIAQALEQESQKAPQKLVKVDKPLQEQSFEDFKNSMNFSGKESAFDELEKVTK